MWLAQNVERNRRRRPDDVAVVDDRTALTWAELDDRTDAIAGGLLARGVQPGDRVLLSARNGVAVIEVYVAAAKAGIVVCPVNPTFPGPEFEHVVTDVEPVGAIVEPDVAERLGEIPGRGWSVLLGSAEHEALRTGTPAQVDPPAMDAPFLVVHTSATTGRAKGVVLTHRAVAAAYTATARDMDLGPHQRFLHACPLFHGSMLVGLAQLAAGGALIVPGDFAPQRFLDWIERHRPTLTFVVPAMIGFAMRARAFGRTDLSSLREVVFGGSTMAVADLREALHRFGVPFRSSYGLSEAGPIATARYTLDDGSDPLESSGHMHPGVLIEIRGPDGSALPAGQAGEVCVRAEGVMSGYWRNPDATGAAVRAGWLRTGDIGRMDAAGDVVLLARRADVIIRGGQNVYPAEVERVLRDQEGVREAVVIGAPSAEWGQVPVAFVVVDPSVTDATTLVGACARRLGSYKRPVSIHLTDDIPRNAAGKIVRRELHDRLERLVDVRRT